MGPLAVQERVINELQEVVKSMIDRGVDFIKLCASGAGMTAGSSPLDVQFSLDEIRAVVNSAHDRGVRVAAHAMNTEAIRYCARAGVDTIEHCVWFNRNGAIDVDSKVIEEIVAKGIFICPTISTGQRSLEDEKVIMQTSQRETLLKLRKERSQYLRLMVKEGVKIIAGCDAGYTLVPFSDFPLEIELLVSEIGLSSEMAIACATQEGAVALGIGQNTGTIERGKSADIILVSSDPLRDITALRQVATVVKEGIVYSSFENRG